MHLEIVNVPNAKLFSSFVFFLKMIKSFAVDVDKNL